MPRKKKNVPMEENGKQEDAMKYELPVNEEENVVDEEKVSDEIDEYLRECIYAMELENYSSENDSLENSEPETDPFVEDPFGNDDFGNDPFGEDPFGSSGFGSDPFGADPFGNNGFGSNGFGSNLFGADPFGNSGFGSDSFGNFNYPFEIETDPFADPFSTPFSKVDVRKTLESGKKNIYSNRVCDMNEPFAFISYTHNGAYNNCFVMAFFEHFYNKLGYNLWIDYANLPKNESHWNVAARKAIFSRNCKLVLFFRNEFSTINENVYKELELAKTRHIPIIPIDFWQFVKGASEYREFLQGYASADVFLDFENIADKVSIHANAIQAKCEDIENNEFGNAGFGNAGFGNLGSDDAKCVSFYRKSQETVKSIAKQVKTEFEQNGLYDKSTKNIFQMLSKLEDVEPGDTKEEREKVDRRFFQLKNNIEEFDLYNRRAEFIGNPDKSFAVLFDDVYSLTKYSVLHLPFGLSRADFDKSDEEIFWEDDSPQNKLLIKIWRYLFATNSIIKVGDNQYMLTKDFPAVEKYKIGNNHVKVVDNRIDEWAGRLSKSSQEMDIISLKEAVIKKNSGGTGGYSYRVDFAKINRELESYGLHELSLDQQKKLMNTKELYRKLINGEWNGSNAENQNYGTIDGAEFAEKLIESWDKYHMSSKFEPADKEVRKILLRICSQDNDFMGMKKYLAVLIQKDNGDIYLQRAEDYFSDREKYKFINYKSEKEIVWINYLEFKKRGMLKKCDQLYVENVWHEAVDATDACDEDKLKILLDFGTEIYNPEWEIHDTSYGFGGKIYKDYSEINENDAYKWWMDSKNNSFPIFESRSDEEHVRINRVVKELEEDSVTCENIKSIYENHWSEEPYFYDGDVKDGKKLYMVTETKYQDEDQESYEFHIKKNSVVVDIPSLWEQKISEEDKQKKISNGVIVEDIVITMRQKDEEVIKWVGEHMKYASQEMSVETLELCEMMIKCR